MPQSAPERVTAEELFQLPLFEGESLEAVEWIASQLEVRRYEPGDVMVREGDPVKDFIIVLEGEMHFRPSGFDEIIVATAGRATGVLPFSRMKTAAGRGWAVQPTKVGTMDASLHRELVYRAPILAQRLVSEMTDRTRMFTRMEESSNRLLSLGKLAAGLAHELNNPASAAVRSSARLREVLTERRKYAIAMLGNVLPERAREIMSEVTRNLTECATTPGTIDALERADLESDLADWLQALKASRANWLPVSSMPRLLPRRSNPLLHSSPLKSSRLDSASLLPTTRSSASRESWKRPRAVCPILCKPLNLTPIWTRAQSPKWMSNRVSM